MDVCLLRSLNPCSQSVMIFPKQNTASSMLSCWSMCQEFYLKPALQSSSASHLWNSPPYWVLVHASAWEKIPVELSPPAHHLLPLTGDQQLVEERAVGEREDTMIERWLRCRERLKHRTCRIHIGFTHKVKSDTRKWPVLFYPHSTIVKRKRYNQQWWIEDKKYEVLYLINTTSTHFDILRWK